MSLSASSTPKSRSRTPIHEFARKQTLCKFHLKNEDCPYGSKCSYAHGEQELQTGICKWQATCKRGLDCPFKHDQSISLPTSPLTIPMPLRDTFKPIKFINHSFDRSESSSPISLLHSEDVNDAYQRGFEEGYKKAREEMKVKICIRPNSPEILSKLSIEQLEHLVDIKNTLKQLALKD